MAAAKVSWDSKLKLDQSCRLCRREDYQATREVWGCDKPAPSPLFELTCWDCAPRPTKECVRCNGTGKVQWMLCPRNSIDPAAFAAVRAVDLFCEFHTLPRAGGWGEQHVAFRDAFFILIPERARYERERYETKPKPEPRHDPHPPADRYGYLRTPEAPPARG